MIHQPQMTLPGQQPQQPQPQPSMVGAVPGQHPTTVNGQYVDASGRPVQPQQQAAPYGTPQQQWNPGAQPQGQPSPPTQSLPQPQPPRQGFTGQEVLDGPGIPAELRGRRISDVMNIYSRLIDHYAKSRGQGQDQPQGGQPNPQSQGQPQQPGQRQLPPPQPQTQQSSFMTNLQSVIRDTVSEVVNPIQQRTIQQGAREAEELARRTIPDYQEIEPELRNIIATADPEHLTNPEFWQASADLARGRYYRNRMQGQQAQGQPQYQGQPQGQPQPQPNPYTQSGQPTQMSAYQGYQPNGGPQSVPAPPTHSFFTESPTPPNMGQSPASLTPYEIEAMKGFGIPEQEWAAWKNPIQMAGASRGRRF